MWVTLRSVNQGSVGSRSDQFQPSSGGREGPIGSGQFSSATFGRQGWSGRAPLSLTSVYRGRCIIRCRIPHPFGVVGSRFGWQSSPFSSSFLFRGAFGCDRTAGDKQPRSYGGFHDLLERCRFLGAHRAGRDWFSPSGVALGSDESSVNPPCVGPPPEQKTLASSTSSEVPMGCRSDDEVSALRSRLGCGAVRYSLLRESAR